MSADNYYFVYKYGTKFGVSMGFMSDESTEFGKPEVEFDTLTEAIKWAHEQYSEYGVQFAPDIYES